MSNSAKLIDVITKVALPIGIIASGIQYSMYDVKGGSRGVIFDRINGVKQQVVGETKEHCYQYWYEGFANGVIDLESLT